MKQNRTTAPHTHPAILAEREKMFAERAKALAPRRTYASHPPVEFEGQPVSRPPLDVKRDLPEPAYRPGALDFKALPSRGF